MERSEFKKRCKDIFENWNQFEKELDKLLDSGIINLDEVENNYRDCYPVVAAILERCVRRCINGSFSEYQNHRAKRQMNKYLTII